MGKILRNKIGVSMKNMISIVVPVYNVKEYIGKLVESVLMQNYNNYELILVNNNSTDGSEELCMQYCKNDSRIVCIDEKKQGVGAARNAGLRRAKGEYIIFFDSDDYIEEHTLEKLVDCFDTDIDMVACGYNLRYKGDIVSTIVTDDYNIVSNIAYIESLFENDEIDYQGFIWDKMFRKKIIDDNSLEFREDIAYNEDRLFITQYMLKSRKMIWVPYAYYNYQVREDSAMGMGRQYFVNEKEFTELIAFDEIISILSDYPEARENAINNMAVAEIRLFRRMLDKKHFLKYRSSIFRKYARRFGELNYKPKNELEAILIKKIFLYGKLGITFSSVNVREDVNK